MIEGAADGVGEPDAIATGAGSSTVELRTSGDAMYQASGIATARSGTTIAAACLG